MKALTCSEALRLINEGKLAEEGKPLFAHVQRCRSCKAAYSAEENRRIDTVKKTFIADPQKLGIEVADAEHGDPIAPPLDSMEDIAAFHMRAMARKGRIGGGPSQSKRTSPAAQDAARKLDEMAIAAGYGGTPTPRKQRPRRI